MGGDFVHALDAIYLVRQQLVVNSHAAVYVPANIVAKVRVETEHRGKGDGPESKSGWVNRGANVKLTFQGFITSVPLSL